MARDDLHFRLRIPDDLKSRIETAAANKKRSMTAEIIARLEEYEALGLGSETLPAFVERLQKENQRLRTTGIQLPNGLFYRVDDAATRRQRSIQEEVIQALERAYPAPVINEMDEVGHAWWQKIAFAPEGERENVLREANEDLKSRGWQHEFWLKPSEEHGGAQLVLGIRKFGLVGDVE